MSNEVLQCPSRHERPWPVSVVWADKQGGWGGGGGCRQWWEGGKSGGQRWLEGRQEVFNYCFKNCASATAHPPRPTPPAPTVGHGGVA